MSNIPKRIWTTLSRGGEYAGEHRELYKVEPNQYGDYLFTLDGGDVWQFTITSKIDIKPTAENVFHLGVGRDHVTGKPGAIVHFLGLEGPEGKKFYNGNLRILPREPRVSGAEVRLDADTQAKIDALAKNVPLMGEMLDAANEDALSFKLSFGDRVKLTEKELIVAQAIRDNGTISAAARALQIKYPKGKGFSQGNVSKIVKGIRAKVAKETGRNPKSLFAVQEPERHACPPDGTNRK